MARDYATKRSSGRKRQPTRRRAAQAPTPGWVWLLLGIAIGVVGAAAYWITRPAERDPRVTDTEAPSAQEAPAEQGVQLPPEEEARFSFYEMLPSYEVVIPRKEIEGDRQAAKQAPPDRRESSRKETPALAEEGDYIIQIGSYRSRDDAERQRAELALIGVEARVESVTINDNQTWYRVRVGPIAEAPRVHSVMMRLSEHGMDDAMLVRVRK
jgi:cell division protein FtsN